MPSLQRQPTFAHLVYIPFTGVGIGNAARQPRWFKERIEIFKKTALKSLLNQTNKNFIVWLSFDPKDKENNLCRELTDTLQKENIIYFATFDGLMYWDDKFGGSPWLKIKNVFRIIRSCWRNNEWQRLFPSISEIIKDRNQSLKLRLEASLNFMKQYLEGAEWVYMTRLDSDDMLESRYIETMQMLEPFAGTVVCKNGYIYNLSTKELALYEPDTNPPFHTVFFPWHVFVDPWLHAAYYKDFRSHEDIIRVFEHKILQDGMYCVTTHNPKNHISTIWNHPFKKQLVLDQEEKTGILKSFGL